MVDEKFTVSSHLIKLLKLNYFLGIICAVQIANSLGDIFHLLLEFFL